MLSLLNWDQCYGGYEWAQQHELPLTKADLVLTLLSAQSDDKIG